MRNFLKCRLAKTAGAICLLWLQGAGAQTYFIDQTDAMSRDYLLFNNPGTIGEAIGDYNNDGWPDIFHSAFDSPRIQLLENQGDLRFVDRTDLIRANLPNKERGGGTLFGDYDNDGDLDLFVPTGRWKADQAGLNVLLRNDKGVFVDVTREAGLLDEVSTDNATWLDYDRDGYIDLYLGNVNPPEARNILYHNMGDGTFVDATAEAGLDLAFNPKFDVGSNGGLAARDFDGDGWTDLYVAVWQGGNHLFLNDQGHFRDATTEEITHEAQIFGLVTGDIDNDLDLDLFVAGSGNLDGTTPAERSVLFTNFGNGLFLNTTDGVGLSSINNQFSNGPTLADIDNDGDLDLLINFFFRLFINEGDGLFVEQTELASTGEIKTGGLADLDLDGFLDMNASYTFHRNRGNDNHWLQVELVGTQSNRNGFGTRLFSTAGDLRQLREIPNYSGLGGFGISGMDAHFGLGSRTQVDQLEIRWPSGQVDILENIPADQKIRVIEGRGEWYLASPTVWETPPPTTVEFGAEVLLSAIVRPALFEPTATITSITADLSGLGGPDAVPLEDLGDGRYQLVSQITIGGESELRDVEVFILQETSLGEHWINLSRNITVEGDPFTAVLESFDKTLPQDATLDQNYPNPFNSGTVIRFALPKDQEVTLAVYNLAGQRIAQLAEGMRVAGSYTVTWDGRDDEGRTLASGVYLYRLQAGAQVETRKLLLLR